MKPMVAFSVRADGWIRDHTGAWHEPGHPYPIRIKMPVRATWTADWKGLAVIVWAWIRGRSASVTIDLDQDVWLSTVPETPTKDQP